jgi:hypothetical protein
VTVVYFLVLRRRAGAGDSSSAGPSLHSAQPRQNQRRANVIGELAQLAGWVASDAGQYTQAQQHYLSGVIAAEQAGDKTLGAQLLSCLAYQIANIGKRADALLIVRSAVKGATEATPVVRALLLERLAWAATRFKTTTPPAAYSTP